MQGSDQSPRTTQTPRARNRLAYSRGQEVRLCLKHLAGRGDSDFRLSIISASEHRQPPSKELYKGGRVRVQGEEDKVNS